MVRSKGALPSVALALALVGGARTAAGDCPAHLFVVARSKNANVVAYDAAVDPSGRLASKPVVAYWLLDGDPGKREELNSVEWRRAYGFSIRPGAEPGTFMLEFNAGRKRRLTIRVRDGCPIAIAPIEGHEGVLRRIFVKSNESGLMPSVEFVEFFGEDAASGQPLYEKFAPK